MTPPRCTRAEQVRRRAARGRGGGVTVRRLPRKGYTSCCGNYRSWREKRWASSKEAHLQLCRWWHVLEMSSRPSWASAQVEGSAVFERRGSTSPALRASKPASSLTRSDLCGRMLLSQVRPKEGRTWGTPLCRWLACSEMSSRPRASTRVEGSAVFERRGSTSPALRASEPASRR